MGIRRGDYFLFDFMQKINIIKTLRNTNAVFIDGVCQKSQYTHARFTDENAHFFINKFFVEIKKHFCKIYFVGKDMI